jgi:hypothetical protein
MARSLAIDCLILKGLMGDVVSEGRLAFLFSEKGHLRCVVDGSGGLRSRFLGAIVGIVFRDTNGGRQMLELIDTWSS